MKDIVRLLTAKDVGRYLQMPLRTVHHLSKTGKIKGIKIGGKWRYLKEDIDRYLSFGTDFSREPERRTPSLFGNRAGGYYIERRYYPRINTNFRCRYSVNLDPFKNIENEGMVKNMSAGGVLVVARDSKMGNIGADDQINIDFYFSVNEERIDVNAQGRVVRIDNDEIGIVFRNIPEGVKEKISKFVG